jgi:repressor LexA
VADRRRADDGDGPALSKRQRQILDFIEAYVECDGVPPSFKEIGDAVGLKAISAVSYQVKQLQAKGLLSRRDRMPRTIVAKPRRLRSIPPDLDGVLANPDTDDMVGLPLFAVRVAGDSMVDANIFDGDCLVVRQQADAVNGDIVIALDEDENEGVVKTFRRTENHVWLMPENSGYDPILGDGCRIMGKVVATLHSRRKG